ncbi:methylmalonyl Co-A mutase-associated GTPase MeaB [Halorutilales archaeon Cl-col2-1]
MSEESMDKGEFDELVDGVLDGKYRSLARLITHIENQREGYRDAIKRLHQHTGDAHVIGVTGSPGAGKSTLVDKMVEEYREQGKTVGVIAVDPSSPYTGGSLLGDRIRLQAGSGDMDVFFRSMSSRGALGGLSSATTDAIKALDAFGKDVIIVETVGAGQNEVEIVRTADSVLVLLMPSGGDDIQMIKAGILEIGDIFVVNKADLEGADRTVMEVKRMIEMREDPTAGVPTGHHGPSAMNNDDDIGDEDAYEGEWKPEVTKTIAERGDGVTDLLGVVSDHREYLIESGEMKEREFKRYSSEIHSLLEDNLRKIAENEIEKAGGIDALAEEVVERESDPYTTTERMLEPITDCIDENENGTEDE